MKRSIFLLLVVLSGAFGAVAQRHLPSGTLRYTVEENKWPKDKLYQLKEKRSQPVFLGLYAGLHSAVNKDYTSIPSHEKFHGMVAFELVEFSVISLNHWIFLRGAIGASTYRQTNDQYPNFTTYFYGTYGRLTLDLFPFNGKQLHLKLGGVRKLTYWKRVHDFQDKQTRITTSTTYADEMGLFIGLFGRRTGVFMELTELSRRGVVFINRQPQVTFGIRFF